MTRIRRLALTALALVAAGAATLLAPAPARAHTHDPNAKCTWQADRTPSFVMGQTPVYDSGTRYRHSIVFGSLVGKEIWDVVVLPGYHFGWVHAWDKGVPLESSVTKAYARCSLYNVLWATKCCQPQRFVKPTIGIAFRVRAMKLNDPGVARAQGVTQVLACNTGVSCVGAGAATTSEDQAGAEVQVHLPLPSGAKVVIPLNLDFDSEEESIDAVSVYQKVPAKAAVDEEYVISTDLDLLASADGAPWDTGAAAAELTSHDIEIKTDLECTHCTNKEMYQLRVNATNVGSDEGDSQNRYSDL